MKFLRSGCQVNRALGLALIWVGMVVWSVVSAGAAGAQTLTTLASFDSSNGENPHASLVADGAGNLFGTTVGGGLSNGGTVFEIAQLSAGGYASTPSSVFQFDWDRGAQPQAGLITDAKGNLFGTTYTGGAIGYGTLFEIPYNAGSYGAPIVLVNFNWSDGANPQAALIADASGNLFGTTYGGGLSSSGTVFELPYNASTGSYASSLVTLVNFDGSNGRHPEAGLTADANGNLFGTTFQGGAYNFGTAFEIPYDASTGSYDSSPITLVDFNASNGEYPQAGLIADASGNLFGTTFMGGSYSDGTVFEIPYNTSTSSYGAATVLLSFNGSNGANPEGGLIIDANGSLFGTASGGGVSGRGTAFEIPYSTTTASYGSPAVLVNFAGSNGTRPGSGLIADASGNLFGTTYLGGYYDDGTVFELANSGFVPPQRFAGTPGKANCAGVSISTLARTYGGIAHAAASLNYASVAALQSTVRSYCGQ